MIHVCCSFDSAFCVASNAQWIDLQKAGAGLLPLVAVATLCAATSAPVVLTLGLVSQWLVLLTVALTSDQGRAGRRVAWLERAKGH